MSDKIDRSGWQVGGTTYDLLRERDELRAALEAAMTGWRVREAEIERLHTEVETLEALAVKNDAEIERLRAALVDVANISYTSLLPDRVVEIVTAALERAKE